MLQFQGAPMIDISSHDLEPPRRIKETVRALAAKMPAYESFGVR